MNATIGLGTGRCGTYTLAHVLGQQPEINAQHERKPPLSWCNEPDPLKHFRNDTEWIADVGFYYLPHVPRLMQLLPDAKFVCMKRDRDATIRSFLRVRPEGTHWFSLGGNPNGWDRCFPTYECDFETAVGLYWDHYYAESHRLECERFRVFETDAFNCERRLRELLKFVGVKSPVVEVGIKLNVS